MVRSITVWGIAAPLQKHIRLYGVILQINILFLKMKTKCLLKPLNIMKEGKDYRIHHNAPPSSNSTLFV
jgi:hypothetical protein